MAQRRQFNELSLINAKGWFVDPFVLQLKDNRLLQEEAKNYSGNKVFIASAACCWYSRNESKVASCYLKHWLNPFCFSNLSSHIHFKAITHWWTTPLSRCHLSQWVHLSIDQNRLNAGGCITAPLHKRARAGFYWIPFYRHGAAEQQVNQGWGLSEPQQHRDSAPILSQVLLNLRNLMNIWVDWKFLPSLWFSGDVGAALRGAGGDMSTREKEDGTSDWWSLCSEQNCHVTDG